MGTLILRCLPRAPRRALGVMIAGQGAWPPLCPGLGSGGAVIAPFWVRSGGLHVWGGGGTVPVPLWGGTWGVWGR